MVGEGTRFKVGGYTTPKPLISVSGKPMAVQALRDLPRTDSQTFVLREDLQNLDILKAELDQASSNSSFCILKSVTDGQATTCIEGSRRLNSNLPITIAACDNGMNYDSETFLDLMEDESVDIIVWGARGYPGAIRAPEKYGWIDTDDDNGYIKKVSVKKPLSDPSNDPIIVGAFMFKRLVDFIDAVTHMKSRKAKINGEYYIDTAINDAIQIGKRCKILEIEHYICWGSPNDLKTFEYWQSCFHKWSSHPYSLGEDPYLESDSLSELIKNYSTMWDNRNTFN